MLVSIILAGSIPSIDGQSAVDGAITGQVTDQRGDAITEATVTAEELNGGRVLSTKVQTDGRFFFVKLQPGQYRISVAASGFERSTIRLPVELGSVAVADLRLSFAPVLTLLTVNAAPIPSTVEPEQESASGRDLFQASTSQILTAQQTETLPLDGRRWQSVSVLLPGVNDGSVTDSEAAISFRGIATTQNSTQIDGVSADQSFGATGQGTGAGAGREAETAGDSGQLIGVAGDGARAMYGRHAGAAYIFSQSAVQEFRVHAGSYSALDGHSAGGVVTTVSKSGTTSLKGTLFYQARDSAWAATNPFSMATRYTDGIVTTALVRPRDLRQQFGGSLGGPVEIPGIHSRYPAKWFYFVTLDQQRRGYPAISSPGYAQFYSLTETQQALLANRGVSLSKTMTALNYLDSLSGKVDRRADQQILFGKLDYKLSSSNQLSMQANHVRWNSPAGLRTEPVVDRATASIGNVHGKVDSGVVRWTDFWTSRLSNEARLAYTRDFEYETPQQPLAQEPAIGPGGLAPEVYIGPEGFFFGTPAALGRKAYPDEWRFQAAESAEWTHGKHLIQLGIDFSRIEDRIDALSNQEGTFLYDSGATNGKAGGLVDWITDYTFSANAYPNGACPSITAKEHLFCFRTYTQSFGQQTVKFNTTEWAGFLQDEWRAAASLQISAGLRYEYEREPPAQHPNPALDLAFGSRGVTSILPEDRNNIGPRLGVAWSPFGAGKGIVRVGYGLYFGRLPGATIRSALIDTALPSSATHVRITPATITGCPQVANQGFGYGCDYLSLPPAAISSTTSATLFDKRFRLPAVQQGTVELEREFGPGITVTASYLINLDRQLSNSVDINIAPATVSHQFQLQGGPAYNSRYPGVRDGETFVVPFYTERIDQQFGPVTDIVSNANGTYHALVLSANKRTRAGLEFRLAWTWAKAIDYGQNNSATPQTNGQFDPFTLGYDKGLSTLNFPHKVVTSVVWEPAWHAPTAWLRSVANNWQISPVFVVSSGRPYSYEIFGGTRLEGGHTSINGSGGAVYLPTVGRNTLRLPEQVHSDLRVSRTLRLTERVRLRGVFEVFNLPNHVNYSSITTRAYLVGETTAGVTPLIFQDAAAIKAEGLNAQPFGAFTAASTSNARQRQIQIGLKLDF